MSQSIGVVIPCKNNSLQLYGILYLLDFQTELADEIVVIDDNSSLCESDKIMQLCNKYNCQYIRLPEPKNSDEKLGRRSMARNIGSYSIDTDIILYLDGDMLISPRYIETIKYYHNILPDVYIRARRYSVDKVESHVDIENHIKKILNKKIMLNEISIKYAESTTHTIRFRGLNYAYLDQWNWCASNNLSVRRKHVIDIGFWDEEFVGWGEEDMDFSYRLYKHGLYPVLLLSNRSRCFHIEHDVNIEQNIQTLKRNAKYFLQKYPEVISKRKDAYERYNIRISELID